MEDIRENIQLLAQQLRSLVQVGVIVETNYEHSLVRVELDTNLISPWIPWGEHLAGTTHTWKPPKVGDQAVVLCANGDISQGIIITYLNQNKYPQISTDGDLQKVVFANGSSVAVHEKNNTMNIHCIGDLTMHATGKLTLSSGDNMVITSDTDIAIRAPHIGEND